MDIKQNNDDTYNKIYQLHKLILKIPKDSVHFYLSQTNKLITTNTPDSLKAENEYLNGYYHYNVTKEIDSAYIYYHKAINYSKGSIQRKRELNHYGNLAIAYNEHSKIEEALYIINKFEKKLSDKNYIELKFTSLFKQDLFYSIDNFDSVKKYNNKYISIAQLDKDTIATIKGLISKADLNYYYLKNTKKAYKLIDSIKNLKSFNKLNSYLKSTIYESYGMYKYDDRKYNIAYINYIESLKYIKKSNNKAYKTIEIGLYVKILDALIESEKFNKATFYLDTIFKNYQYLDSYHKKYFLTKKLKLNYLTNTNFNEIEKNLDSVYDYINNIQAKKLKNRILGIEKTNKKERKLLLDNQKKENKNQRLKKRQYVLFSILTFLSLGILSLLLFFRQKKLKTSRDAILMQQRLFRAQMNPHFTSNILYSIQNLNKEDSSKANSYITKFSRLLRITLENSTQNFVSIEKEIEVLEKYLDLQLLRFPNKFEYNINHLSIDEDLGIKIPPMLIQPFVENAIEHAFKGIDYLGKINISLVLENDYIHCVIEDNGTGIKSINENKVSSTQLIGNFLKKTTSKNIKITSKETPSSGTIITFDIPFEIGFD